MSLLWIGRQLFLKLRDIVTLQRRLHCANTAAAMRPDEDADHSLPVNWWQLLRSGFTPVEYEDPHEDPHLHLGGRPWRVLHDGSLRIPVFRKWSGKPELQPQQLARIAAYCHLIGTAEGGKSPYGVVLFQGGVEGVTVPYSEENRRHFFDGLRTARETLRVDSAAAMQLDIPPASHCEHCPLGKPHVHLPGQADTWLGGNCYPAFRTRGKDNRLYHSVCGDRFRTVPPNAKAAAIEIC